MHAALELLRDAFGDQLRVELGLADLGDVDAHVGSGHAEQLRRLLAQLLDVLALLADHDARTRRLDRDVRLLRAARSIWMRLTEASCELACAGTRAPEIGRARCSRGICACSAYHFEVQSRVMPRRMPIGLTF